MATIVTGETFERYPRQLKQQPSLNSTVSGHSDSDHDPKSGFCSHTGIYHSVFKLGIPRDHNHDVASFILSNLPPEHISETRVALVDSANGSSITYSYLTRSALSLAAALHHGLGLRKGDVILLLLSPTSILYPAICLAILATGAIITPADPAATLTTNEVAKQVHNSGAKLAISALEDAHKVEAAGIPVLTTTSSKPRPQHDGEYPAAGTGNGMWPLLSVEELMESGDVLEVAVGTRITQSDMAVLFYPSSSSSPGSSKSKGVLRTRTLTHGDLISMSMIMKWGVEKEIISSSAAAATDEDVFLYFPQSHVCGLTFFGLGLLCVGATTVVMTMSDPFDSQAMMEAVEKHRISNILAAPTAVLSALNQYGSGGRRNLSLLRRVSSMGTDRGREVGSKFRRMFPWVVLREGYGIGMTVFASEEEARDRRGSAGQLLPLLEGKVVELRSRRAVGPGAVGELWLRGPTVRPTVRVMEEGRRGEDQDEDESDEVAAAAAVNDDDDGDGGWVRTGDLAYFDADGFLYIVDRIQDLINRNGHQVSPAELEAILATHPQILDAAVTRIPDQNAGHVPMAYVVRASAESTLTCEEVVQFAATRVAPYKKIEKVAFINAIPKSATGRILRKQLAAQNKQAILPAKL